MITSLLLTEYSESSQRDFFLNYEKTRLNASFSPSPGNAPTSTTSPAKMQDRPLLPRKILMKQIRRSCYWYHFRNHCPSCCPLMAGRKRRLAQGSPKTKRLAHWSWGIRPKICIILKGHSACLVDWTSRVCMMNLQFISSSSTD